LPSKQAITFPALGAPGSALIVTATKVRVPLSHPVASFLAAAYAV
jgi:hypothetical protein